MKFPRTDPNLFISGGWDDTIQIYDIRTNGHVGKIMGPHICGDGLDIYANTIAAASYRSEDPLQLFDLRCLEELTSITWQSDASQGPNETYLQGVSFAKPHGELLLAAGSGKNELRLFDVKNIDDVKQVGCVTDMPKACLCVDYGNLGGMFAVGGADGCVRVLNISR